MRIPSSVSRSTSLGTRWWSASLRNMTPGAGGAAVTGGEPTEVAEVEGPVERDEAVLVCRHTVTVRTRR